MSTTPPIACTLAPGDFTERVASIADLNRTGLRSHRQARGALTLVYAAHAAGRVAELVERERACCGFLRFTLEEAADAVRLTIEVPGEVRDTAAPLFEPFLAGVPDAVSRTVHLLAISGSLRAGASNTALLDAAALLVPPGVAVTRYDGLGALPPFNPDLDPLDGDGLPAVVADLRARVLRADGLLLSSPEYAHGVAGAFKNLLDWLVGGTEFPGTPVALLSPSPLSVHAPAQLREVLTTMNARLVEAGCVTVPLYGRRMDGGAIAADPDLAPPLRAAVAALAAAVRARAAGPDGSVPDG